MVPSWQLTNEKNFTGSSPQVWSKVFFYLRPQILSSNVTCVIVIELERKEYLEGFRMIAEVLFSDDNEKPVIRDYILS